MIHGKCKSAGCYAMTDALIEEIYALARECLPRRPRQLPGARLPVPHDGREHGAPRQAARRIRFWRTLKEGYDYFELTRQLPTVAVCNRRYVVNVAMRGGDPTRLNPAGGLPGLPAAQPEPLHAEARRADRRAAHRRAGPEDARPGRASSKATTRSGLTRRTAAVVRLVAEFLPEPRLGQMTATQISDRRPRASASAPRRRIAASVAGSWLGVCCSAAASAALLLAWRDCSTGTACEIEARALAPARPGRARHAAAGHARSRAISTGRLAAHGVDARRAGLHPHLQARVRARAVDEARRPLPALRRLSRSAAGRAGSGPSSPRATARRRRASTPSMPRP